MRKVQSLELLTAEKDGLANINQMTLRLLILKSTMMSTVLNFILILFVSIKINFTHHQADMDIGHTFWQSVMMAKRLHILGMVSIT